MVTKELLAYIKKQLEKNQSKEDIKKILAQYKWAEADIAQAFDMVEKESAPVQQPKPEQPKQEPVQQPQQPKPIIQAQKVIQPEPQKKMEPIRGVEEIEQRSPFERPGGQSTGPLQQRSFNVVDETNDKSSPYLPWIIGAAVVFLIMLGLILYFAFRGTPTEEAPTMVETPFVEEEITEETPAEEPEYEYVEPAFPEAEQAPTESMLEEFNYVIKCLKDKSLSLDEKEDCSISDRLVNLGFFFERYKDEGGEYPVTIDDIFALGDFELLNKYGPRVYDYAYTLESDTQYKICVQYITKGYRCFVNDSGYVTKAQSFMSKLK